MKIEALHDAFLLLQKTFPNLLELVAVVPDQFSPSGTTVTKMTQRDCSKLCKLKATPVEPPAAPVEKKRRTKRGQ